MRSWASHDESYDAFDYFTGAYPDYDDDPLTLDGIPEPHPSSSQGFRRASGTNAPEGPAIPLLRESPTAAPSSHGAGGVSHAAPPALPSEDES